MTNRADRFSRSVIPQGFYAGYSERNVKAFTLIELLVVVLIIGILAAVALPQYQKAIEKSRAMQGIALLKAVYEAQKVYHLANGSYATNFEDIGVDVPWTGLPAWSTLLMQTVLTTIGLYNCIVPKMDKPQQNQFEAVRQSGAGPTKNPCGVTQGF